MAIPEHLFYLYPMGFREEDFCYAESISYINIKAGIYEVLLVYAIYVYAYWMFHNTHSEPRHKAEVSGHFDSPVAISPVKAVLLPNDKEAVWVLESVSFLYRRKTSCRCPELNQDSSVVFSEA